MNKYKYTENMTFGNFLWRTMAFLFLLTCSWALICGVWHLCTISKLFRILFITLALVTAVPIIIEEVKCWRE